MHVPFKLDTPFRDSQACEYLSIPAISRIQGIGRHFPVCGKKRLPVAITQGTRVTNQHGLRKGERMDVTMEPHELVEVPAAVGIQHGGRFSCKGLLLSLVATSSRGTEEADDMQSP